MTCRLFGHRWSNWVPVARYMVGATFVDSDSQARFCRRCERVEFRG